ELHHFESETALEAALAEVKRLVNLPAAVQQPNRDAVFEAVAERLGEHEKAYNEFDPSDEAVTCITLKGVPVEVLAEFIAPAVLAALAAPATGETATQYRAVWPGGSVSMPLPSP